MKTICIFSALPRPLGWAFWPYCWSVVWPWVSSLTTLVFHFFIFKIKQLSLKLFKVPDHSAVHVNGLIHGTDHNICPKIGSRSLYFPVSRLLLFTIVSPENQRQGNGNELKNYSIYGKYLPFGWVNGELISSWLHKLYRSQ